ncbi:hypothetical protein Tter_2521 [Thermobaculum terrenum ATCC BAA-798]|uniref:Glycoside hydrolase family 42 N-terminal domain-containing protein n=1 Tax=Thermobaculum terrenum (strain ATCC BAA-798 / CCMEE 7001 / YNP1) TaxID=525904 RepID=D1CI39_THET1|nr:glycoside hydrolase family 99-like domain-containing protein [Thermobaculum terrenum]ACZ43410.1 hypothetical protein Tter_2521 [Thermobaculum terrenum ATCC BAA-798]
MEVGCYVFPHYHRSALNDVLYGPGWTEYVLLRGARPWFEGHPQPRTPLLGELDEREPSTWHRYIQLARAAGIDVFIFDWYWYGGGPVLHEALEEGLLGVGDGGGMRFAVMWTNHPWAYWFPTAGARASQGWLGEWEDGELGAYELVYDAPHGVEIWRSLSYILSRYCGHPWYWRVEGRPVVGLWDVSLLVGELGLEGTRRLLEGLRELALRLGLPGIHFHAVCQEPGVLRALGEVLAVGVDSYGLYNSVAVGASRLPISDNLPRYEDAVREVVERVWPKQAGLSALPYWPCVSPGCDDTPRHLLPRDLEHPRSWRTRPVVGETPEVFEGFVRAGVEFLQGRGGPKVLLIGSWNEWTEGHYLLPDTRLGFGMLRALQRALTS